MCVEMYEEVDCLCLFAFRGRQWRVVNLHRRFMPRTANGGNGRRGAVIAGGNLGCSKLADCCGLSRRAEMTVGSRRVLGGIEFCQMRCLSLEDVHTFSPLDLNIVIFVTQLRARRELHNAFF